MNNVIQKYIPEKAIPFVQFLIDEHSFELKIVNQRQTKHGDFRKLPNGRFQITVNNNLNKQIMIQVKQLHRVMPEQVEKILDYLTKHSKGEDSFKLLDDSDQNDVISMLCDNPSEWKDKINKL